MYDKNCLIWVFLGWNLKKLPYCGILHQHPQIFLKTEFQPKIKIFKFKSEIVLIAKVPSKNKKTLSLGPKIPYLGIFGLQFNKNYYQIFNQHSWICENIKFHPKTKKYYWDQKCSIWIFGLEYWKTIVIFVVNALQFI